MPVTERSRQGRGAPGRSSKSPAFDSSKKTTGGKKISTEAVGRLPRRGGEEATFVGAPGHRSCHCKAAGEKRQEGIRVKGRLMRGYTGGESGEKRGRGTNTRKLKLSHQHRKPNGQISISLSIRLRKQYNLDGFFGGVGVCWGGGGCGVVVGGGGCVCVFLVGGGGGVGGCV